MIRDSSDFEGYEAYLMLEGTLFKRIKNYENKISMKASGDRE